MKIYFLIYDKVEELDLVGSWELIGLLAEKGLCENPNFSMTPSGERGLRFSADYHFTDPVLFVPGGSGERIAIEDQTLLIILKNS